MATHLPEEIDYNPLSPEARSNPEVQWGVLRRIQPVHHFALPEDELKKMSSNVFAAEPTTEFWTVLRHQHVEEVLSKPQLFLSCQGPGVDCMRPDPNGGVLIFADGKVHRRHRQLASKAFAPRSVERLLPQIQQSVDALIDEHAARGRMELTQALAVPLAMDTILKIMGLPADKADDFHRWGEAITNSLGGEVEAIESGGQALVDMFAYLQTLIDAVSVGASCADNRLDNGVLGALVAPKTKVPGSLTMRSVRFRCKWSWPGTKRPAQRWSTACTRCAPIRPNGGCSPPPIRRASPSRRGDPALCRAPGRTVSHGGRRH
jgi:cytochrome P450